MRGVEQTPWLYDLILSLSEATGFRRWRRWIAEGARGRTLDLGCGTGRTLPLLRGVTAVAVDPSRHNLRAARRRAPHVPLVRASAEALPFRDGAFDTVMSSLVLCSVPDPARGLAEIQRVLAPGGELRAIEHVRATAPWKARLQDALAPAWRKISGGCNPNRNTEATVSRAGFEIDPSTRRAQGTMRRFRATAAR